VIHALIMAGGRGTRFWPKSRTRTPKQLQAIVGARTMLQETVARIAPLVPASRVLVATGRPLVTEVRAQVPGIRAENLIVEPVGRDTAPCVVLAAAVLLRRDPDAVVVVLPSDHVVTRPKEFAALVKSAATLAAREECLVTLAIKVLRPETGYGYIEMGQAAGAVGGHAYRRVKRFTEKPPLALARRYMRRGNYGWNSGMFVWSARAILAAAREFLPETLAICERIADAKTPAAFTRAMGRLFPTVRPISVDYGILEKARNLYAFPTDIGWSDVGNWNSLTEVLPADDAGNVVVGRLLGLDAADCIVHTGGKLVAAIGVKGLVIVDTPDALLVCRRDDTQRIKDLVGMLEKRGEKNLL
jgi:mannose-1-phosphate guanylyltransferase